MIETIVNGKYELKELVSESRLYEVYEAREIETGTKVAVKLLQPESSENVETVKMFSEEVRMAAGLSHPSLVQIIDFDTYDGRPFSVTEFVSGKELRECFRANNSMSFLDAGKAVQQLAVLLQYAFDQKLAIRTIKPSNIFRTDTGLIKVLSFSLPRLKLLGDKNAETAGIQSDIFFLGTMFFELLSGDQPIRKRGGINEMWDDKLRQALRIRHPQLAPEQIDMVVDFIERTITRDLKRRFSDHADFLIALSDLIHTSKDAERDKRNKRRLSNASEIVDAINGRNVAIQAGGFSSEAITTDKQPSRGNMSLHGKGVQLTGANAESPAAVSSVPAVLSSSPARLLCPAENMQLHGKAAETNKTVLKLLSPEANPKNKPKKSETKNIWNAAEEGWPLKYSYFGIAAGGLLLILFISLLIFW